MATTGLLEVWGMHGPEAAMGIAFFLVWLVMMAAMVVSWVLFLVAVWRGMKAHESIAGSVRYIAEEMARKGSQP